MNDTTGCVFPESTEQSKKNTSNENIDLDSGLNNFQGQKMDDSNKAWNGREIAYKNKGKQSYANLFKDNRAPIEASLLRYIAPTVGEIVIGVDEIDSVEETFGFCLVGYVMGNRPSPYAILKFVKGWGGNVKVCIYG